MSRVRRGHCIEGKKRKKELDCDVALVTGADEYGVRLRQPEDEDRPEAVAI